MADEKDTKDTSVEEATPSTETKEEATPEAPAEEKQDAPVTEEKKEETPNDDASEGEDVEVPAEFKDIVEKIETMSVLELHKLVKLLEKKFGVSAQAVAVAGAGAGDAGEEKTEFDVELTSDGGAKIPVMKVVKEILGLGLKEAKDMVENLPTTLKAGVKKEEAEEMKAKLEEAGGKVELK